MKRRIAVAAFACAALFTIASTRAAEKRFITETDLLKFTWIADPQISPDGSSVAFVRVTVNEKENRYETSLFIVPTSGAEPPRRLTSNIRDTSPRWAPDGKRLAFLRSIPSLSTSGDSSERAPTQLSQIYLLAMDGGEARPLTELPHGVAAPVWSPDGKTLAFAAPVDDRKGQEGQDRRDGTGLAKERCQGDHARGVSRQRQSDLCRIRAPLAHFHAGRAAERGR